MADDKSSKKQDDLEISDLNEKSSDTDDAKVKGGMRPRGGGGGHMTYTGEEIDTQTGA